MKTRFGLALALVAGVLMTAPSARAQTIEGQYIVVLERAATPAAVTRAQDRARSHGGEVRKKFATALKGFSRSSTARRWRR